MVFSFLPGFALRLGGGEAEEAGLEAIRNR